MPSSRNNFLAYEYKNLAIANTTGYFECVPKSHLQTALTLTELISLLKNRPNDTFLKRHIQRQLLELNKAGLEEIIATSINDESPEDSSVFAAIIFENFLINADFKEKLNRTPNLSKKIESVARKSNYWPYLEFLLGQENLAVSANLNNACMGHLNFHKMSDLSEIFKNCLKLKLGKNSERQLLNVSQIIPASEQIQKKVAKKTQDNKAAAEVWQSAVARLDKAGLIKYPEMRHESSLSPIALLREWPLNISVNESQKVNIRETIDHTVEGKATCYGRGLSLAQARASLHMEMIERASAYADISNDMIVLLKSQKKLVKATCKELDIKHVSWFIPVNQDFIPYIADKPFYWLAGQNSRGEILVPCQSVFLFCNLNEPIFFDGVGSSGLGAGMNMAHAKLSAVLEIIERDSHATHPFDLEKCFIAYSRNPLIQSLLEDYNLRGIYPFFQDITGELGIPAYRCFVKGQDEIAQGLAAGLNGMETVLSALTETPWPYSWATPAPYGKKSLRPPANLPIRYLEDLPDFSYGPDEKNLEFIEKILLSQNLDPIYIDLTRSDLDLPVTRAFIPGLEMCADFDFLIPPSPLLLKRLQNISY